MFSKTLHLFFEAEVRTCHRLVGSYLAKCHDSLNSQSLMYVGDKQSPGSFMSSSKKKPAVRLPWLWGGGHGGGVLSGVWCSGATKDLVGGRHAIASCNKQGEGRMRRKVKGGRHCNVNKG